MSGPVWVSWPLAFLMVLAALIHSGRLLTAHERGATRGYDVDLTHLMMSVAMATMLVTDLGARGATAWAAVVGIPLLWFAFRAFRSLSPGATKALVQPLQHLSSCVAMLFMLVVAAVAASGATAVVGEAAAMAGMAMPAVAGSHGAHVGHGGQAGLAAGGSISSVAVISVLLVGTLLVVAAQQGRQLRVAVDSDRAWSMPGQPAPGGQPGGLLFARGQHLGRLLLTPGLSLVCQLAMSGAMIYMLVLMV